MIFYTHVEHSPTKTIYIKYYMEKQKYYMEKQTNKHIHYTHTHTHTHTHDVLNREPEPHISSFSTVPVLHTQIHVLMPFEDLKLTELKVDIGQ